MLINLRNALMTGKRLPYDAEVEYLQSTGTQYIDTGVVWNRALTVSATVVGLQSTTFAVQAFFGARNLNAANAGYTFGFNSSNRFVSDNSGSRAISSMSYAQGAVYTIVKNLSGCSITNAAGTTENLINNAGTQTATYNLLLFGLNNAGTPVITKCRFYGCKIWDANGVLVRDLIPVRKGTVGYLYDRVSGKLFGNGGSGDFVLGQDVVPVEWLASHGSEYIDTGYNPHGREPIMSVDMVSIGVQSRINMFGCNDTQYFWLTAGGSGWATGIGGGYGGTPTLSQYANIRVRVVLNARALTASIDNTRYPATVGSYSRNLPNANVYLFDCNGFAGRTPFVGRIYGCTIEDESVLVRDFIPVRKGAVGYLYDRVSGKLFGNAGTGAFAYGNDLKYPIPA